MCLQQKDHTTLGFSPDALRQEQVSFSGKLKHPLVFRDAMLMLREIVISDSRKKRKDRIEFFQWLEEEIEKRVQQHEKYLPDIREELEEKRNFLYHEMEVKEEEIQHLYQIKNKVKKEMDQSDAWCDYYLLERKFWNFIQERDYNLWFVLDPVITVHPDQVSFEAFSADESIYGCLSINKNEFEMLSTPKLGTTNIDFSAKLAKEMERFRTYTEVELSVNPEGFTVDTGVMPEHLEKKIDLPESWIQGFNQVSAAANLPGISISLSATDMYDICSFLRRHKADQSPRYMKWILEKNKHIRIVFEPFGTQVVLKAIYTGDKKREEKIWGRRRWLIIEKLIPLAKSFEIKLFGFGMPQFIIADLGTMKMTIGFSSWSANDWVKGTAFHIMSGFIGEGNYKDVYSLMKEKRYLSIEEICDTLNQNTRGEVISGIGSFFRRGEGYFDAAKGVVRFRQLCNQPIPTELYQTTNIEQKVQQLLDEGLEHFKVQVTEKGEYLFSKDYKTIKTELIIDEDGQISKLNCGCKEFRKGPKNISSPCAHILALYIISAKFTKLELEHGREYKINDIMEMLL